MPHVGRCAIAAIRSRRLASLLFPALILSSIAGAQALSPSTPVQAVVITDPAFENIPAFTLAIPAGWQFLGKVVPGIDRTLPSLAFRARSPDGLTQIRVEPVFDWQVVDPKEAATERAGLPVNHIRLLRTYTAAQFAERYAESFSDVRVVGPMDQERRTASAGRS